MPRAETVLVTSMDSVHNYHSNSVGFQSYIQVFIISTDKLTIEMHDVPCLQITQLRQAMTVSILYTTTSCN